MRAPQDIGRAVGCTSGPEGGDYHSLVLLDPDLLGSEEVQGAAERFDRRKRCGIGSEGALARREKAVQDDRDSGRGPGRDPVPTPRLPRSLTDGTVRFWARCCCS